MGFAISDGVLHWGSVFVRAAEQRNSHSVGIFGFIRWLIMSQSWTAGVVGSSVGVDEFGGGMVGPSPGLPLDYGHGGQIHSRGWGVGPVRVAVSLVSWGGLGADGWRE